MKNITTSFSEIFLPRKALVIYRKISEPDNSYVESYDFDKKCRPINAHPLTMGEAASLADCLNASTAAETQFLQSRSLLPPNILFSKPTQLGFLIWYTPARTANLLFKKELGLPSGPAKVPALVWKANRQELRVFALRSNKRPQADTPLYHAPFFNLHEDGRVCMGTVDIEILPNCCLEEFIQAWDNYFWQSDFSHLLRDTSPVSGNIIQLWEQQMKTANIFPSEILIKNGQTLKDLIL